MNAFMPIPGLRYIRDYLDRAGETGLLTSVDAQRWLASVDHGVQIYGYRYSHQARAAYRVGEVPDWGYQLAARLDADGLLPGVADQLVANQYQPGEGLFEHVD